MAYLRLLLVGLKLSTSHLCERNSVSLGAPNGAAHAMEQLAQWLIWPWEL